MFERKHYILAAVVAVVTLLFAVRFLLNMNHEFLIYVVVVVAVGMFVAISHKRVHYPYTCLVGLAVWAVLHLSGGGIRVRNDVLYGLILIPISETYSILRYDQVVHAFGFGVSTLIMYHLLANLLSPRDMKRFSIGLIAVMAGAGLGALNENIEFLLTVFLPQTGVGGYENTSLDLCSNLTGAVVAYVLARNGWVSMKPGR
jgi:hypothetical protein